MADRILYLREAKRLYDADATLAIRLDEILADALRHIHDLPEPLIPDRWPTAGFDRETTRSLLEDLRPNSMGTLRKAAEELALARERDGTLLARPNFISV